MVVLVIIIPFEIVVLLHYTLKKKARRRRKDQEKDKDLVHTDKKHGTYVVSISSIMLLQSGIAIVWGSGGYCL